MQMKKLALIAIGLFALFKWLTMPAPVSYGPGVAVNSSPIQTKIVSPIEIRFDDYSINSVANFRIKAKVLAKKSYSFGREADLSPMDLALGWGRMSDESVLDQIKISQANRFFSWRVDSFPIPRTEIETHSANMHMIPANDDVNDALERVRQGQIIELSGKLVNVKGADGWRWKSSLRRTDTGAGACELILVESVDVLDFY